MTDTRPYISVIVPVYNAEGYIHRCVDSLLQQTYIDFEIILVDDGSPDGSGAICDEYARKDSRVKVIHKENGGVASARQLGIDNAKGEYTIHADPDDWVEPTMLEQLCNKAKAADADMVICDFWVDCEQQNIYRTQQPTSNSADAVLDDLLFNRMHGSLCNKLIKRDCYSKFKVSFVAGLNYCEDYLVCVKLLQRGIKVAYLNKAFYHYDQIVNSNSITRNYTLKIYRQRVLFIDELKRVLNEKYSEGILKNEANVAMECLSYKVLTKKEFKAIYSKNKWKLLKYINGYRSKIRFLLALSF